MRRLNMSLNKVVDLSHMAQVSQKVFPKNLEPLSTKARMPPESYDEYTYFYSRKNL